MKFFIIEWWDAKQGRYHQEYFSTASGAVARFVDLQEHVKESNPDIETKHFEDV